MQHQPADSLFQPDKVTDKIRRFRGLLGRSTKLTLWVIHQLNHLFYSVYPRGAAFEVQCLFSNAIFVFNHSALETGERKDAVSLVGRSIRGGV